MKSNVLTSIALSWFSAAISTILVLFFSEIGWRGSLMIGILSILILNSLHIFILQLVFIPLTHRNYFNNAERFFFAVLPWLALSGFLLIAVYNQGPILYSCIAIQYFTAVLSYHFYYSEKAKEAIIEKEYALLKQEREAKLPDEKNPIFTE